MPFGLTFAGAGDTLASSHATDVLCDVCEHVRVARPGTPLTVSTLGLVPAAEAPALVTRLAGSGVERASVLLNASNPAEYKKIMQPEDGLGFGDVCAFIAACSEGGIPVVATAAATPGVNMGAVRDLALALGAVDFVERTYHP